MKLPFLALLASLSGCSCQGPRAVARVGQTALTQQDLEAFAHQRGLDPRQPEVQASWLAREQLAEVARSKPWAQTPEVQAQLRAAQDELLAQVLVEREAKGASTDEQVRARYEEKHASLGRWEVHVQHLVLRRTLDAKHNAENAVQIQELAALAPSARAFGELARTRSEDALTAAKDGDLGVLREGEVDSVFFNAARALHAGEVSKPVETSMGWHLLRAIDEPVQKEPPLAQVAGRLQAELRHEAELRLAAQADREVPVEKHLERLSWSESQGRAP